MLPISPASATRSGRAEKCATKFASEDRGSSWVVLDSPNRRSGWRTFLEGDVVDDVFTLVAGAVIGAAVGGLVYWLARRGRRG